MHAGIWKNRVHGRRRVGRLNLEGDGQERRPDTEVNSEPSSCIRLNRIAIRRSR